MAQSTPVTAAQRKAERERKKLEKEKEEAAAARLQEEKEAAERQEREAQKKERDAERKREEEAEKQRRAAAAAAAAGTEEMAKEEADEDINEHLSEINKGGGEGEDVEMANPSFNLGSETKSPPKKKKKKDKKKEKQKEKQRESSVPPTLRKGRFSEEGAKEWKKKGEEEKSKAAKAAEAARKKAKEEEEKKEERKAYVHKNSRVVMECSVVCSQEEEQQRYNELPLAVRTILKNMQKVDDKVCLDPIEKGEAKRIWEVNEIPYDHTDLGNWVQQSGGMQSFAMKKPRKWGKQKEEEADDDALVMPEVYFTISFSCDKDPHRILERIAGEWGKTGGKKLYIKEVASFTTQSVVNIFHLRNDNTTETIMAELTAILEEARAISEREDSERASDYVLEDIPAMALRKLMPKITGQDTSLFQGWSGRQHEMRKTLTVEADESKVEMLQYWVETAKNRKIFEKYWGHKVKVMAVLDNRGKRKGGHQTQTKVDMAAAAAFARRHVNYHSSTRMDGIRGIIHLDKEVEFYSVTEPTRVMGTITLRMMLYKYVKMSDDHGLFNEVHQGKPLDPVDVAVPNCEEAERMLLMMQKNSAAYLWFYFKEETNLGEELIARVIRASMDPILVNGIDKCSWEKEHWIMTTPEDAENEKLKAIEEAAWYNDEFGDHMVDTSRKEKREYANKEALAELHGDHSYKSIHQRKGNYAGSPGEQSFQLGRKEKPLVVEDDDGGEGYQNLSSAELIALLKQHNITPKGAVGSPPNSAGSGSGRSVEDGESSGSSDASSSSGSSGSSNSSGSVMSMTKNATSSPGDGDGAVGRKPDHGE